VRGLQAARGAALNHDSDAEPSDGSEQSATAARLRRPLWIVLGVAAGVVALDQISKWWVQQVMPARAPIDVIGHWLQITYTRNPGAAFSLGGSFTVVLSVIAITVAVVIVRMASKLGSVAWAVALGGILGGAVGNLIDRLFRAPGPFHGHVVDWIAVPNYPVFNIADSAIFCSAALMIYLSFRGVGLDGSRPSVRG
jgi:signal peptidase II